MSKHIFFFEVKKNIIYYDKTQNVDFQGRPPFQATKQHLDKS